MSLRLIQNLYQYKGFIFVSVKREFQAKYQNSLLGALWTVLNPLAMILVYTIIFSQVMQARLPDVDSDFAYSIYLCSGVLTWGLFAEIVGRGQQIFLDNANILKKLQFPRLTLPIIVTLSACLNFAIIFSLFILFLVLSGNFPGWVSIALIPVLMIQLLFSLGLGVSIGVLNVFFRDVGQLFTIILQFWFWLTPIVYPISILPDIIRPWILTINPLAAIMASYQTILVKGQWPDWNTLTIPLVTSLILCVIALKLFKKHAADIVDEL